MTPNGPSEPTPRTAPSADDEVIDLTDGSPLLRPPSGRPADLLPHHHLVTVDGGDRWMRIEAFVYDLYRQLGYCEESPRARVEELARWNDRSRFHAVIDDDEEVIGVVRNIFGPYAELPVGQFTRTDDRHRDPVCEMSSLTVRTDMRSTGVIEHLYRASWHDALRSGAHALVALVDMWLYEVIRHSYRLPFRIIGPPEHYMGSDPRPVGMTLEGPEMQLTADENPGLWAWGLELLTLEDVRRWDLPLLEGVAPPPSVADAPDRAAQT